MGAPSVAVIDPGMRVAELDCFNRMSLRSRLPLTYHLPAMFGMGSLNGQEPAGIIVLGSAASVYDDLPWQHELKAWLAPRLRATPVLGLCYGHQLLAFLLGGEVGFRLPTRDKRVGMRPVRLTGNQLWGGACSGELLVSHREVVTRVPAGCAVVGSSEEVEVEAIAHSELPLWGFQAHPEATPAFAANNNVPVPEGTSFSFGNGLVDAFLEYVARTR